MKSIIFLLISINIAFSEANEFDQTIFVNGQARKATFTRSKSSESWFSRDRFFTKSGQVIDILSPDTFLIQTESRQEEIKLIGLLDISSLNDHLSKSSIKKQLKKKYLNRKVRIYKPKAYVDKGLDFNHAYIIQKEAIVNLEILSQGLGILHDGQEIITPIKNAFVKAMEQAETKNKGLWEKL
ncbi:MAG: hypothetical protein KC646_14310 [Candidatus Cloacimonetes bacterium]|nr:hypothetical protein [Candidatus Cloacimonadota bacterium]